MSKSTPDETERGGRQALASVSGILDLVGKVVGLTSLIAALLYYFGWQRTYTLYWFFGIDQSVLGFSTQDYLLRSIQVTWNLARWVLVVALGVVGVHFAIRFWIERSTAAYRKWRILLAGAFVALGLLLVALCLAATWSRTIWPVSPMFYSVTWTAGICLAGYGLDLFLLPSPEQPESPSPKKGQAEVLARLRRISMWLFVSLFVVSLFWLVAISAEQTGLLNARQIAAYLNDQPNVTVYSSKSLNLQAPGVTFDQVCQAPPECQYRYTGLKYLVRSGGKYFLLPAGWTPKDAVTIILPDNEDIRVEVAPGKTPSLTP